MKRSELVLKAGDVVVIDYGTGEEGYDVGAIVSLGFGNFMATGPGCQYGTSGIVQENGHGNIGGLPNGFSVIEVNGVAIEED